MHPIGQPRFGTSPGKRTHAANIGLAFGDADDAARIQQVEIMARLHALVISRQCKAARDKLLTFVFSIVKMPKQNIRVRGFKIIVRLFDFGAVKHIAIAHTACICRTAVKIKLETVFNPLHIHG